MFNQVFVIFTSWISFATAITISLPAETAKLEPSTLPGFERATQKCLICHSADLISQQPPSLSLDQWIAEVKKMSHSYGAMLDDDDVAVIAQYLAVTYGSTNRKDLPKLSAVEETNLANPRPPDANALLKKNACLACHSLEARILGPSYQEVAKKYRGAPDALATVMTHIHLGGTGRWGTNVMPPFPSLSDGDLRVLAEFVLKQ